MPILSGGLLRVKGAMVVAIQSPSKMQHTGDSMADWYAQCHLRQGRSRAATGI